MTNKSKILVALLSVYVCMFALCGYAPKVGTWMDCNFRELGNQRVYFAYGSASLAFSVDSETDLPVSISSSTYTGYILNSSGERLYSVQVLPFGEGWQYRSYNGSGYGYSSLHLVGYDFETSTVPINGNYVDHSDMMYYLLIFFGAAILLGVWRCSRHA